MFYHSEISLLFIFCGGSFTLEVPVWLKFYLSANIGLSSLEKTTRVQNLQPDLAPCGQALVDTKVACWFKNDLQNFFNSSIKLLLGWGNWLLKLHLFGGSKTKFQNQLKIILMTRLMSSSLDRKLGKIEFLFSLSLECIFF